MDRRRDKRWPRQLDAKFGRPNEKPHHAVASNISLSGVFLRTPLVAPTGTRLRVELIHSSHGFIAEAIVVRAIKTPSHLQTVRPSGMGLRFFTPTELVEAMLPSMAARATRTTGAPEASEAQPVDETADEKRPASQTLEVGTPIAKPTTDNPSDISAQFRPPPVKKIELDRPLFSIFYRDLEQMKSVFERDIKTGGIFIPSPEPEPLDTVIQVEVGIEGERPVRVDARVVHSLDSDGSDDGNVLVGMGVQFTDPARAILLFEKLIFG